MSFFHIEPITSQRCGLLVLRLRKSKYPTPADRLKKLSSWSYSDEVEDRLFDPEEKERLLDLAPTIFLRDENCEIHLRRDQGFWVVYF